MPSENETIGKIVSKALNESSFVFAKMLLEIETHCKSIDSNYYKISREKSNELLLCKILGHIK